MSGINPTTVQHRAKVALVEAARVALTGVADTEVLFGFRWPIKTRNWFAATDTQSDLDPATVGARRQLDETVTLFASVGAWKPVVDGKGNDAEQRSSEAAFGLLEKVQEHIRLHDPTLGGTVMWCLPGPSESAGAETRDQDTRGRLTEVSASFVCAHRIR